jgi:hypothetical protein
LDCSGDEEKNGSCVFSGLDDRVSHLQVLDNEKLEARIRALIPQMESWLIGTLPTPGTTDNQLDDPGVVFPATEIDIPLIPVRDLLYKGVSLLCPPSIVLKLTIRTTKIGMFTLLRTHKQTTTPHNFSRGIYTALRVDRVGKIGHKEVTSAKSIWVDRQTALSAGLILLITCPPGMMIGEASV